MAIQEIEVTDGSTGFVYEVEDENVELAISCFASKIPIEYVLDEDGKPTTEEVNTVGDRARIAITAILDKHIEKYQKRLAVQNATIIKNIVS